MNFGQGWGFSWISVAFIEVSYSGVSVAAELF
jgi:hypothetical protein